MSRILLVALLVALVPARAGALPVTVLQHTGDPSNRIDLLFLGDGYTATQQEQFERDARQRLADLFGFEPYASHRGLFNVGLVHVVSKEEGADHGTYGDLRNTALGAGFDCAGIDRLVCVNDNLVLRLAMAADPDVDLVVVLVNDPKYGGSGGSVAVISGDPMAADILRHELGHTLAGLADEYDAPYPGYPSCDAVSDCSEPNATLFPDRPALKWLSWVEPAQDLPTPAGAPGVGAFEGCRYQATGVYRPVDRACIMDSLGNPFCPVCAEAMVLGFWGRVSPLDPVADADVTRAQCDPPLTLRATGPELARSRWRWTLDGALQPAAGAGALVLPDLAPGTHQVEVQRRDTTPLVRVDRDDVTAGKATWTVHVLACDGGAPPSLDAGPTDAGAALDAGSDAGVEPGPDAGVALDGGPRRDTRLTGGGGCAATDGLGLVALLGLALRRRSGPRLP